MIGIIIRCFNLLSGSSVKLFKNSERMRDGLLRFISISLFQRNMEQFACFIKGEIRHFLDTYVSSHSLPKANEKDKIHSLESQGEIPEDVQDQLISHLLENFPEIKRLDRDAAEVLYDTVNFVLKTHKEREVG